MNLCDHCDRETVSPTNLCIECLRKGHVHAMHCDACRVEAWETVLRLESAESEDIEMEVRK